MSRLKGTVTYDNFKPVDMVSSSPYISSCVKGYFKKLRVCLSFGSCIGEQFAWFRYERCIGYCDWPASPHLCTGNEPAC